MYSISVAEAQLFSEVMVLSAMTLSENSYERPTFPHDLPPTSASWLKRVNHEHVVGLDSAIGHPWIHPCEFILLDGH